MIAAGKQEAYQQLAMLAQLILSIVPTSAGCERLFSQMGIVHTKLRNRLTTSSARKIVQLKMDVRSRHQREGLITPRTKRAYGRDMTSEDEEEKGELDMEDGAETTQDICTVIGDLMADATADEDVGETGDERSDEGEGMDCDEGCNEESNEGSSEERPLGRRHAVDGRVLPRVVFRWTRELTLARFFDYSSGSADDKGWNKLRDVWVGGVSNLKAEMHRYGLDDVFDDVDAEMSD